MIRLNLKFYLHVTHLLRQKINSIKKKFSKSEIKLILTVLKKINLISTKISKEN